MPHNRLGYPVILASASPRRQELLHHLVKEFQIVVVPVDEEALTLADPWQTAQRLAREKALAVFALNPEALVIAGDTVVALPGVGGYQQLSKPGSKSEAIAMLQALSGHVHVVITGVALRWPGGLIAFTDETKVTFDEICEEDIIAYVETGEPMDKAGAYAIQGGAAKFVTRLEGSRNNVIGLPTEKLSEALRDIR